MRELTAEQKARLAVNFFQRPGFLTHTKGIYARKPFQLDTWQEKLVREVFGTVRSNGLRQYQTVFCMVPKKNGKTELAAGIALYGLLLDNEPGAEVYFAAASRDQASIGFRVAAQMVRNSPRLRARCKIVDSTKTIYLVDEPNSFMRAISADAGVQDGINPHFAVFDELHRQRNSDLWDVLTYGMATRSQPLMFAITTAGISGESPICEEQYQYACNVRDGIFNDPSYYPAIFELGEKEDWTEEGVPAMAGKPATGWYKANPSLGKHLQIDKVREEFRRAQANPMQQNSFKRLRLNQWVGQEVRYIPMPDWRACGQPFNPAEFIGMQCVGGIDLSATQDITALVLLFQIEDLLYLLPHFWIPEHELAQRAKRDKVPYDLWVAQGLVHTTPGNQVDYKWVRKTVKDLGRLYDIKEIAYDRWNATPVVQDLTEDGFNMVPIGQGYQSMSAPTKEMLRVIMQHRLRHNGNDVLTWMANCFAVKSDPADNVKPSKPDRRKNSKRIDGIVASIDALARTMVTPEYKKSVYDERGIRTL